MLVGGKAHAGGDAMQVFGVCSLREPGLGRQQARAPWGFKDFAPPLMQLAGAGHMCRAICRAESEPHRCFQP